MKVTQNKVAIVNLKEVYSCFPQWDLTTCFEKHGTQSAMYISTFMYDC